MQKRITRLWTLFLALALVCTGLLPAVALADATYEYNKNVNNTKFTAKIDVYDVAGPSGPFGVTLDPSQNEEMGRIVEKLKPLTDLSESSITTAMRGIGYSPVGGPVLAESGSPHRFGDCQPAVVLDQFSNFVNSNGQNPFLGLRTDGKSRLDLYIAPTGSNPGRWVGLGSLVPGANPGQFVPGGVDDLRLGPDGVLRSNTGTTAVVIAKGDQNALKKVGVTMGGLVAVANEGDLRTNELHMLEVMRERLGDVMTDLGGYATIKAELEQSLKDGQISQKEFDVAMAALDRAKNEACFAALEERMANGVYGSVLKVHQTSQLYRLIIPALIELFAGDAGLGTGFTEAEFQLLLGYIQAVPTLGKNLAYNQANALYTLHQTYADALVAAAKASGDEWTQAEYHAILDRVDAMTDLTQAQRDQLRSEVQNAWVTRASAQAVVAPTLSF